MTFSILSSDRHFSHDFAGYKYIFYNLFHFLKNELLKDTMFLKIF